MSKSPYDPPPLPEGLKLPPMRALPSHDPRNDHKELIDHLEKIFGSSKHLAVQIQVGNIGFDENGDMIILADVEGIDLAYLLRLHGIPTSSRPEGKLAVFEGPDPRQLDLHSA